MGSLSEDHAMRSFRAALEPEWGRAAEVATTCRGSAKDEAALDAILQLRYAEENAVRREAGELLPLRRRAQAIVEGELGSESAIGPRSQDTRRR
jgi:hypothetical protein